MFYRETGQFKSSYESDAQLLPIRQDRYAMFALLAFAYLVVPFIASQYWFSALLIPVLIFALAALGLNILTGYAGQISLGTAGFMAVGAFACYNFMLRIDGLPFLAGLFLSGLTAALIGVIFGLPSLRIRGLYLVVATLASQFFIVWALDKFAWFKNYDSSGVITAQQISIFGYHVESAREKYLLVLSIVVVMTLAARNITRGSVGRAWMAVRDMDVAAEVIGIRATRSKLLAFALSSFYCGVAGALLAFAYLGTVEPSAFTLDLSFRVLFMIIIGGMGSVFGSFLGAGFILLLPIVLSTFFNAVQSHTGIEISGSLSSNLELMIFGTLIVFFLIVEPHGLARLWQIGKEKLRLWPFPH